MSSVYILLRHSNVWQDTGVPHAVFLEHPSREDFLQALYEAYDEVDQEIQLDGLSFREYFKDALTHEQMVVRFNLIEWQANVSFIEHSVWLVDQKSNNDFKEYGIDGEMLINE